MHELQTIATDDRGVCHKAQLSSVYGVVQCSLCKITLPHLKKTVCIKTTNTRSASTFLALTYIRIYDNNK